MLGLVELIVVKVVDDVAVDGRTVDVDAVEILDDVTGAELVVDVAVDGRLVDVDGTELLDDGADDDALVSV